MVQKKRFLPSSSLLLFCLFLSTELLSTGPAYAQYSSSNPVSVRLEMIASGLNDPVMVGSTDPFFPTELIPFPDGSGRLLVGTLGGTLRLIDSANNLQATPYFDTTNGATITAQSGLFSFGLTAVAFHPDFSSVGAAGFGKFYSVESEITQTSPPPDFPGLDLNFNDPGNLNPAHDRVLYEYTSSNIAANTFSGSKREVLRIHEHRAGHDVNDIAFDNNGYLFISSGDTVVPREAQNLTNVFGKILRIDPLAPSDTPGSTDPVSSNGSYRVPSSNPFLDDDDVLDELYASGLRNAFRISVDGVTNDLYVSSNGTVLSESMLALF